MANFFARYWKTLAISSVTLTTSYFFSDYDHSRINNRLLTLLTVRAAEYKRRNSEKASSRNRLTERRKENIDDEDDDDADDDDDKDELDSIDANVTNIREKRFRKFASIEYNREVYMTPVDLLESIIAEKPRPRIGRRQITDKIANSILSSTPPKHRGSKRFFRNLEHDGLISFPEYLFLWVILTKPYTQFGIAFSLLDTDGNQLIDKHEFLVLRKVMSDKRMIRQQNRKKSPSKLYLTKTLDNYFRLSHLFGRLFSKPMNKSSIETSSIFNENEHTNTTLLLHFFGKNGRDTLNYKEFQRFMENFQTEVLEIEFTEFSHGFKTISDLDFAEILLRYTNLDHNTKRSILKKIKKASHVLNEITFDQFKQFFAFLNNLDEFSIAMRFHQLSNKPTSQAEFQRAVKISSGFELESHLISLIFQIFDIDNDRHLHYDEFMAVMKGRLSRGHQTFDYSEVFTSKFDLFKRCLRERTKLTINDELQ